MKKITLLFFLFLFLIGRSQVITSAKWSDLFSYNNVLKVVEDNGRLIAATENGIFYYTPSTGEVTKLSKASGLHEVKISAFDYNPTTKIGLVGYKNGSMDVLSPDGILLVVDIPIASGYNGDKKINHIAITGDFAAVSVGYGVSIFNLQRKEFGDTCFFSSAGTYIPALESIIRDNKVFSVTANGLVSHEINVTFPVFSTWTTVRSGSFSQISNGNIMAFSNANTVYYGDGSSFSPLNQSFNAVQDINVYGQQILVADQTALKLFDSGNQTDQFEASELINSGVFTGGQFYAGTKVSGLKNESGNSIKPDGPYSNTSYKIDLYKSQIIISSGGRDGFNAPVYRSLGYYHFDGTQWQYPQLFVNPTIAFNILDAVINPAKPTEVFFVNYSQIENQLGIYKMDQNEFVKYYKTEGTGSPAIPSLPVGATFDENNQLFVSSYDTYNSIGFYVYNAQADSFISKTVGKTGGAQKPFTKNGHLYIAAPFGGDGGTLIYNYKNTPANFSDDQYKILKLANGLPVNGTVSLSLDKNDDLWIGTRSGLRVLSNPESAIAEETPIAEPVIIEENGVGEELFRDNNILQITTDSGNQKWVSVDDGGVFYLSPNGEQTFQHFTKANSPLPTNNITDIKVDETTGKVYFVSLDGVVVYQGDVVAVGANFGDVLVYPNPVVYANYKGNVRIRGLAEKTNIRITDAAGNLVHQAIARGGFYEWNLNNQRGVRVASGIYYVLMTNGDGTDTATAKIAVVN